MGLGGEQKWGAVELGEVNGSGGGCCQVWGAIGRDGWALGGDAGAILGS